jgi:hypothetical protein
VRSIRAYTRSYSGCGAVVFLIADQCLSHLPFEAPAAALIRRRFEAAKAARRQGTAGTGTGTGALTLPALLPSIIPKGKHIIAAAVRRGDIAKGEANEGVMELTADGYFLAALRRLLRTAGGAFSCTNAHAVIVAQAEDAGAFDAWVRELGCATVVISSAGVETGNATEAGELVVRDLDVLTSAQVLVTRYTGNFVASAMNCVRTCCADDASIWQSTTSVPISCCLKAVCCSSVRTAASRISPGCWRQRRQLSWSNRCVGNYAGYTPLPLHTGLSDSSVRQQPGLQNSHLTGASTAHTVDCQSLWGHLTDDLPLGNTIGK